MIAPGTVVKWTEHTTGARRVGTVASVRQSRRGPVYRVHEGNGTDPAYYYASRNSRGVLDFPGDVVTRYRRQWWPNPTPGGYPLDHDPAATCHECGSPEPGGGCDADCPTRDDDPRDAIVFIEARDLDQSTGDGSPLTLI